MAVFMLDGQTDRGTYSTPTSDAAVRGEVCITWPRYVL